MNVISGLYVIFAFFFFNDPATPEIYPLSLHDPLPIFPAARLARCPGRPMEDDAKARRAAHGDRQAAWILDRSEEHTSELQSRSDLVCRLLLEKKTNMTALTT